VNPERLPLALGSGPFVETVGRNDAAAPLEGFAKGGPLLERLGFQPKYQGTAEIDGETFVISHRLFANADAPPLGVVGLLAFFVLLAIVPWLSLSRRWSWCLGSLIGAAAGLIVALVVTFSFFPPQLNICFTSCSPSPPPPTPVLETLLLFTIMFGLLGVGQALSLKGAPRKLGWFFTSAAAGLAFAVVLQFGSQLVKVDPSTLSLGPATAAGIAAGAVLGAGSSLLR